MRDDLTDEQRQDAYENLLRACEAFQNATDKDELLGALAAHLSGELCRMDPELAIEVMADLIVPAAPDVVKLMDKMMEVAANRDVGAYAMLNPPEILPRVIAKYLFNWAPAARSKLQADDFWNGFINAFSNIKEDDRDVMVAVVTKMALEWCINTDEMVESMNAALEQLKPAEGESVH